MFSLLNKVRDDDSTKYALPLLQHCQEVQRNEQALQEQAAAILRESEDLLEAAAAMSHPWQRRKRLRLERLAADKKKHSEKQRMTVSDTMQALKRFQRRRDALPSSSTETDRVRLVREYERELGIVPTTTLRVDCERCHKCGCLMNLCELETILRCSTCGATAPYLAQNSSAVPYQEASSLPRSSGASGYDRREKFLQILSTMQAKETVVVPEATLNALRDVVLSLIHI